MNCKKCGNKINDGDNFCSMCGTKVGDDKSILNKNDNINEIDKDKINFKPKNTTPYAVISLIGLFGTIITNFIYKNTNNSIFYLLFMFVTIMGYIESKENIKHNVNDNNYPIIKTLFIILIVFHVIGAIFLIIALLFCTYAMFTCSGMGIG